MSIESLSLADAELELMEAHREYEKNKQNIYAEILPKPNPNVVVDVRHTVLAVLQRMKDHLQTKEDTITSLYIHSQFEYMDGDRDMLCTSTSIYTKNGDLFHIDVGEVPEGLHREFTAGINLIIEWLLNDTVFEINIDFGDELHEDMIDLR